MILLEEASLSVSLISIYVEAYQEDVLEQAVATKRSMGRTELAEAREGSRDRINICHWLCCDVCV